MSVTTTKIDTTLSVAAGYTPTVNTLDDVRAGIKAAIKDVRATVVKTETTLTSKLAIALADYAALRMCVTGNFPKDKDIREFVEDAIGGKDNLHTNLRTMAHYISCATKAGRLAADRNRTSFYVAWNRIADGMLEISEQKARPDGDGWTRDIMCDIAIVRPMEKTGKGDRAAWNKRANRHLPASRKDIDDAYAVMVELRAPERDGSPIKTKREEGVGAGQGATAEKPVVIAELSGADPAKAIRYLAETLTAMLRDSAIVGRDDVRENDDMIGSLGHLLDVLSYRAQPDEFVTGDIPADLPNFWERVAA